MPQRLRATSVDQAGAWASAFFCSRLHSWWRLIHAGSGHFSSYFHRRGKHKRPRHARLGTAICATVLPRLRAFDCRLRALALARCRVMPVAILAHDHQPATIPLPAAPRGGSASRAGPEAPPVERAEITSGLLRGSACLSPKYFYDQRGSELFEAITRLPEYYPTRTERAVLLRHAGAIAQTVGTHGVVIEPGAGSCDKARVLCRLLRARQYVAIDISADYLQGAVARLRAALPGLDAWAVGGDITAGMRLPPGIAARDRLVFYPGSSIGNFDPPAALALLQRMHELAAGEGGGILIGIDLPKDVAVLQAAYDDAAGVTAEFNRNILAHVNRLIGSDFEANDWQHRAFFNAQESRIEMHLEACTPVVVRWPGGERAFAAGERIHTENSYKYPLAPFCEMLAHAGFARTRAWTDARQWFALVHAQA